MSLRRSGRQKMQEIKEIIRAKLKASADSGLWACAFFHIFCSSSSHGKSHLIHQIHAALDVSKSNITLFPVSRHIRFNFTSAFANCLESISIAQKYTHQSSSCCPCWYSSAQEAGLLTTKGKKLASRGRSASALFDGGASRYGGGLGRI